MDRDLAETVVVLLNGQWEIISESWTWAEWETIDGIDNALRISNGVTNESVTLPES